MVRSKDASTRVMLSDKFDLLVAEFSKLNSNLEKILERLSPVNDKKEQPKKVVKKTQRR